MRQRGWLHFLIPAGCWPEEFSCDSVEGTSRSRRLALQRVFDQSWRISFLAVEGLRDVELSERDSHLFVVRCGYSHV